jgi:hypothetical protein
VIAEGDAKRRALRAKAGLLPFKGGSDPAAAAAVTFGDPADCGVRTTV